MREKHFPDEHRVQRVLAHYEAQSDEEAVAEDEAAFESTTHTVMEVPVELVPAVRELIAKREIGRPGDDAQQANEPVGPAVSGALHAQAPRHLGPQVIGEPLARSARARN